MIRKIFSRPVLPGQSHRQLLLLRQPLLLLLLLSILFLAGCTSSGGYGEYAMMESEAYPEEQARGAPSPAPQMKSMAADSMSLSEEIPAEMPVGSLVDEGGSEPSSVIGQSDGQAEGKPEKEKRKRVYSGSGRLICEDVNETKSSISRIAEENGGYVEGVWENLIIIRVPAALFAQLFEEVLAFGEVDFRKTETVDVTEYFADLSTRLEIAEKTRERLYLLLEKTEDLEERLKILREIRRLTEEIESLGNTLRSLEKRIAFSRIQIELQPRLVEESIMRESIPFGWIADLNPLYPVLQDLDKKIEVPLDDSFAVFSGEKIFRAENPDGVRIRISRTPNSPQGDTKFWQEALNYHLSPLYSNTEKLSFRDGEIMGVLFTSKDTNPFHYLVAQSAEKDFITVLEAFFPTSESLDGSKKTVFSAFEEAVLP